MEAAAVEVEVCCCGEAARGVVPSSALALAAAASGGSLAGLPAGASFLEAAMGVAAGDRSPTESFLAVADSVAASLLKREARRM